jgi:Tfp pilus assembly protein PilW
MTTSRHRHPSPAVPVAGFTVVELLVAAALGLVVMGAAGSMLISHIRTITVQSAQLRFQNDWARFNAFVETEVGEGNRVSTDAGVGCGTVGAARLFTIFVGNPVDAVADQTISYNQNGTAIERCGPAIQADGTLATGAATVTSQLLTNATLAADVVDQADAVVATGRVLRYRLTLNLPNPPAFVAAFQRQFPSAADFARARTKVSYIDN